MLEPVDPRVRHTPVLRYFAVLTLLVLVGCGSPQAPASNQQAAAEPTSDTPSVGRCPVDSSPVLDARTVTAVDLDGDGSKDRISLTSSSAPCPDQLFTQLGDDYVSTPVRVGSKLTAYGVDLPGHKGELLAMRSDHPRGGFQLRVYAAGQDALVELEVDGRAVLPFVALDVLEHPLSADCQDGAVVITEAVDGAPRGGRQSWDVRRTSYAVEGTQVTKGATSSVADDVRPDQLESKYPELIRHTMFESCRSAD